MDKFIARMLIYAAFVALCSCRIQNLGVFNQGIFQSAGNFSDKLCLHLYFFSLLFDQGTEIHFLRFF